MLYRIEHAILYCLTLKMSVLSVLSHIKMSLKLYIVPHKNGHVICVIPHRIKGIIMYCPT